MQSNQYSSARIQNNVDYKSIQKDFQLAKKQVEDLERQLRDAGEDLEKEKRLRAGQVEDLSLSLKTAQQVTEEKEDEL